MKAISRLLAAGLLLLAASSRGTTETSVTGIVVDRNGKPIEGIACLLAGTPSFLWGHRVRYSGMDMPILTDKEGRFSISLRQPGSWADLQFDGGDHAPVFLYRVNPQNSPLRVVMSEGKVLRGRMVDEHNAPIAHAAIELQMAQDARWYQRKGVTDTNGEFRFRISAPPGEWPWMLYFAGKRLPIDYAQVTPDSVMVFEASVKKTPRAEPGSAAKAAPAHR